MSDNSLSDTKSSSFREAVLEHLLVGDLLRRLWLTGVHAELLKPMVDDRGYDVVMVANNFTRHIQLKASFSGAKTAGQKVRLDLGAKQSGCVIWMVFDRETLDFESFRWFGGSPGQPLPKIEHYPMGRNPRGDSKGVKKALPLVRVVPRGRFEVVKTIPELVSLLFGDAAPHR